MEKRRSGYSSLQNHQIAPMRSFGIFVCLKIFLFTILFPYYTVFWGHASSSVHPSLYRIYEESVQSYILQDTFYLELGEDHTAQAVFRDLQQQGVVESYSQPFSSLDIPYYRVSFSVREDVAKRLIALMLRNGKLSYVEGVPRFEIQQMFTREGDTTSQLERPKEQLLKQMPTSQFTTQQFTDTDFEWQWYRERIGMRADNLFCLKFDHPKQKVAIIDNGFMTDHPSIKDSIAKTVDVADGDTNVNPPSLLSQWMHGTHGAGLIAGKKHQQQGIIGTSLGSADLYLLKATADYAGPTDITHGIEAVVEAIDLGVDIIVLSRGAYMDFPVFRKVIERAEAEGITVIAAAGNYGHHDPFYPAAYPSVISVGSFGKQQQRSTFSNHGSRVDVYAPGESLIVPVDNAGYAYTDGTSAAAPLFAGVYALLSRYIGDDDSVSLSELYTRTVQGRPHLQIANLCPTDLVDNEQEIDDPELLSGDETQDEGPEDTTAGLIPQQYIPEQPLVPEREETFFDDHTDIGVHQVADLASQEDIEAALLNWIRVWGGWIFAYVMSIILVLLITKRMQAPRSDAENAGEDTEAS